MEDSVGVRRKSQRRFRKLQRQPIHVSTDLPRRRKPHLVARQDVLQRAAQVAQAVGLADEVGDAPVERVGVAGLGHQVGRGEVTGPPD